MNGEKKAMDVGSDECVLKNVGPLEASCQWPVYWQGDTQPCPNVSSGASRAPTFFFTPRGLPV